MVGLSYSIRGMFLVFIFSILNKYVDFVGLSYSIRNVKQKLVEWFSALVKFSNGDGTKLKSNWF